MERAYWTTCLPNHLQGTFHLYPNIKSINTILRSFLLLNLLFSPDTPEWSLIANGESFHKVYWFCPYWRDKNNSAVANTYNVDTILWIGSASLYAWKSRESAHRRRGEPHQVAFSFLLLRSVPEVPSISDPTSHIWIVILLTPPPPESCVECVLRQSFAAHGTTEW